MGFIGILLLALGQAMDAVAVSATTGAAAKSLRARDVVVVGLVFGGFQGVMPALGYALGAVVGPKVVAFDHWIAFVILVGLGLVALRGALRADDGNDEASEAVAAFGARRLLLLGVATSIDAFTVGVTLPLIGAPLLLSCVTIGVVTGLLSGLAVVVGQRVGAAFGKPVEVVGALALMGMGVYILVDHLRG